MHPVYPRANQNQMKTQRQVEHSGPSYQKFKGISDVK